MCIRGAGIVGRSLALLLARERLHVRLVQAPSAAPKAVDVRAYSLNNAAKQLLENLRCWPASPAVTPVQAMQVFGDENGELNFLASEQGCDELNWMVDVPALEAQLEAAVRFQPLIETADSPAPAPLTIVCEGRASQTRAELGVSFDIQHYPHHAVAARLQCALPHQGTARQWFRFGATPGLTQAQPEVLALLPLGGEGAREVALVWSVHPSRAQQLAQLTPDAFAHELEQACGLCLGSMQLSSERAVWPLQLARASRWIGAMPGQPEQSFVLAGDAAHAMHPLAGQGLNVGLADAAELIKVIQGKEYWRPLNDLKLLRRYERARQADVIAMGMLTDGLQRLFAYPQPFMQQLRNRGMQGFDRLTPLKRWMTRHAMGLTH